MYRGGLKQLPLSGMAISLRNVEPSFHQTVTASHLEDLSRTEEDLGLMVQTETLTQMFGSEF